MARRNSNWISAFLEYTDGIESPRLCRKWAAIGTISSVLQRRVNVRTRTGPIYPNTFILMVARPGVGKSVAINQAEDFIRSFGGNINLLPTAVASKEQLYNEFQEGAVRSVNGTSVDVMCSATALPDELGVFIRQKDHDFMQDLIKLYDCKDLFTYKLKHGEGNRLEKVSLSIIGGTQPDTLRKILPPEAFGMGFAARLILIYSNERIRTSVFHSEELDAAKRAMLLEDLRSIFSLAGRYVFTPAAAQMIEDWYAGGMQPVPVDRRLESYTHRRLLHLFKLSMICTAARTNDLLISADDVQEAIATMLEAERDMSLCFQVMGENSSITSIENVYVHVLAEHEKRGKRGVPEHYIRDMLMRELPVYAIRGALDEMIGAGWLKTDDGAPGNRTLFPNRKIT